MIRILLAEDQEIVRQGLKVILEQDKEFNVVHQAANGQAAVEVMNKHFIDIILMDVRMPIMNGIEATRIIKQQWPEVKILMLTTFNDEEYALEAFKEGANGFLLKTAESEKLIRSVRSCLNGGMVIHDDVAAKVMPKLLQKEKPVELEITLSDREKAIAKYIGEGKTNKEIAEILYLSVGTIKNHITLILQKANLRDRTQIAIFAIKHGLVH